MPQPNNMPKGNKRKWIWIGAGGLAVAFCLGGAGLYFQQQQEAFTPPLPVHQPVKPAKPANKPSKATASQKETPKDGKASASAKLQTDPSSPLLVESGVMRRLTQLQSMLEQKKLEVAIEKENQKLRELQTPPAPVVVPQPVVQPEPVLPDLPEIGSSLSKPKRKRPDFYVVSIQGLDGNLSATVGTPSGTRTVRAGDKIGGKRVENISVNGVTIRSGGRSETLAFEE